MEETLAVKIQLSQQPRFDPKLLTKQNDINRQHRVVTAMASPKQ